MEAFGKFSGLIDIVDSSKVNWQVLACVDGELHCQDLFLYCKFILV